MLIEKKIFCKEHHSSPDYIVERDQCLECMKSQLAAQEEVIRKQNLESMRLLNTLAAMKKDSVNCTQQLAAQKIVIEAAEKALELDFQIDKFDCTHDFENGGLCTCGKTFNATLFEQKELRNSALSSIRAHREKYD